MKRPPSSLRLEVELLTSRELPSALLSGGGPMMSSPATAQSVATREAARRTQSASNPKQTGVALTSDSWTFARPPMPALLASIIFPVAR